MYVITNGDRYIFRTPSGYAKKVEKEDEATLFQLEKDAVNYLKSSRMKWFRNNEKNKFGIVCVESDNSKDNSNKNNDENSTIENKTMLEDHVDFIDFMKSTISLLAELEQFKDNMKALEEEENLKILDYRHYNREKNKLNGVAEQRLRYCLRDSELSRKEYKRNRLIAEIILKNPNRLFETDTLNLINKIMDTEYKPRILSFDTIDKQIGIKKST